MSKRDLTIEVPIKYKARPYQMEFWEKMKAGYTRAILVWHRRAGKELTCFNYMIMKACQKVGVYYYLFPEFGQGRKILWDGMDKQGFKTLDHIPKELIAGIPNSSEMKVRLLNGSIIQVIGTDNFNSIMGTNPCGCVFSEYSLQDPRAWGYIRPILTENGGWAVFNGTPRGANHFKDLYDKACDLKDTWFSQLLTVEDTKAVPLEDIKKERDEGMSEDMIQQEFYCSFTLGIEGSYYARYMKEMRDSKRIGNVPWDRTKPVYLSADIGFGDSTSIIFYQIDGREIHIIDFYENHNQGFPHYAGVLKQKPYIYSKFFMPHDAENGNAATGFSVAQIARHLGFDVVVLKTQQVSPDEGIEAVRGLFPRFWIDATKCERLIKCIENYRKKFDVDRQVYMLRPVHDWASHAADSLRYLAIATKIFVDGDKQGIDDRQAEQWYNKFNPVFG